MSQTLAAAKVEEMVASLAAAVTRQPVLAEPVLIGLRSRGVPLAERLAAVLGRDWSRMVPVGSLDITFYRDDLALRDNWPTVRGSAIPFEIDGRDVLLVDDVLQTGRTMVAALRAILDLGRPARLRLAVLVDRGGREFPIHADFAGLRLDVASGARVQVRLMETDGLDEVVIP